VAGSLDGEERGICRMGKLEGVEETQALNKLENPAEKKRIARPCHKEDYKEKEKGGSEEDNSGRGDLKTSKEERDYTTPRY